MFCSEFALVKHSFPDITVIPLKCRCWSCDECRPMRKARLMEEAKAGTPRLFITLTSKRRGGECPDRAARRLVDAWRTVRTEYLKKHGKDSLHFLAVFEATKLGWPHLHIVARARWVDQRWLSRRMGALIGSPIVDVREIGNISKRAAYITKYIGKNPHRFAGVKRYWRSLKYLTPNTDEESATSDEVPLWCVEARPWTRVVSDLIAIGYDAEYRKGGAVLRPHRREPGEQVKW